jgi:hypothetical protein
MEAHMRSKLVTAMIGASVLADAVLYAPLASADPYFYRENSGTWTNAEYNDGNCHYYYEHNAYDGETHVNRYGDCASVAVGPNGEAMPIVQTPTVLVPMR